MKEKIAVIGVDIQNAFGTNGEIAVPGAENIVAPMNIALDHAKEAHHLGILTADWHHPDSKHFIRNGGKWSDHGQAGTRSADFLYGLRTEGLVIVHKGLDINNPDGYTAFEDGVTLDGQPFDDLLKSAQITAVIAGGLIYNVCVKRTLIEVVGRGFKAYLLEDATWKLDLPDEDSNEASRQQMEKAGVKFIYVDDYINRKI